MRKRALNIDRDQALRITATALLLAPYLLYTGFVIHIDRGPVDYETFMDIGRRLTAGQEVYGENSYYPMPYVMIFALLSLLPRPVSMAVWLLAPVFSALLITRGNPLILLFAPLFGHCAGGQSAIFGMLGLWGYRKHQDTADRAGGAFLGLTTLKPQLGIIPVAYACVQWWKAFRATRRIPRQAAAGLAATLLLYLPGFVLMPDWPARWLSHPRPLGERAMAGFLPRTLLVLFPGRADLYWPPLVLLGSMLLAAVWYLNHQNLSLDPTILWGFVVSPLAHDYDLIQLVPLLEEPLLSKIAVWLSIPGWWVILFAYGNNHAWYLFTLIAPGLLGAWLWGRSRGRLGQLLPEGY